MIFFCTYLFIYSVKLLTYTMKPCSLSRLIQLNRPNSEIIIGELFFQVRSYRNVIAFSVLLHSSSHVRRLFMFFSVCVDIQPSSYFFFSSHPVCFVERSTLHKWVHQVPAEPSVVCRAHRRTQG